MRVLVCGGRDFTDDSVMFLVLSRIHAHEPFTLVIHGGASGADTLAGEWASARRIPVLVFAANWNKHGRAAGPIRNQQMIDEGKPDLVVAFPGGRGTADMVRRARQARVRVVEAAQRAVMEENN